MTDAASRFDEVGTWSVLKLDIIEQYGAAYTKAFNKQGSRLKKYYVDGFSGAGVHIERRTREEIEGSPARALKITPPFDGFYFIDMNADKTAHLQTLCAAARTFRSIRAMPTRISGRCFRRSNIVSTIARSACSIHMACIWIGR
jgi:three-Cys-motif partner protein